MSGRDGTGSVEVSYPEYKRVAINQNAVPMFRADDFVLQIK